MRETEHCALKLTVFYLSTSFRGLLPTLSCNVIVRCNGIAPDNDIAQERKINKY